MSLTHPQILLFLLSIFLLSCERKKSNLEVPSTKNQSDTATAAIKEKIILFYGNSITAGYGLDLSEAFPAIIQKRLDSLNLNYKVVNAGVSGETSTAGLNRLEWTLKQPVDIFVLELGANDGLRGIKLSETKKSLTAIIRKVKDKYPDAKMVLAGMEIPPNMGKEYTEEFRIMYNDLAKENNVYLIPFLLKGVGGEPKLNLPDGIHPTAEGHKILAENVWEVLKDLISIN